jgi:cytochrome c553
MPSNQPSTVASGDMRSLTDADIEAVADAITRQTPAGRTDAARRELNQTIRGQATRNRARSDARLESLFGLGRPHDGAAHG